MSSNKFFPATFHCTVTSFVKSVPMRVAEFSSISHCCFVTRFVGMFFSFFEIKLIFFKAMVD